MTTIRERLEEAEVALRLATVESLERKQDEFVPDLFEVLNSIRDLLSNMPIRSTDNTELWRHKLDSDYKVTSIGTDLTNNYPDDYGYKLNFDLNSNIDLNTGDYKTGDVITFPTPATGSTADDVITFGEDIKIGLTESDEELDKS
jgi:hypothetical protein